MKIDKSTVEKIAELSRLKFDDNAKEKLTSELNTIISWIDKLEEVDTDGVEPLTGMSAEINVLREDEPSIHMSHEEALKNAPKKDSNYFRVPKVLDK